MFFYFIREQTVHNTIYLISWVNISMILLGAWRCSCRCWCLSISFLICVIIVQTTTTGVNFIWNSQRFTRLWDQKSALSCHQAWDAPWLRFAAVLGNDCVSTGSAAAHFRSGSPLHRGIMARLFLAGCRSSTEHIEPARSRAQKNTTFRLIQPKQRPQCHDIVPEFSS